MIILVVAQYIQDQQYLPHPRPTIEAKK